MTQGPGKKRSPSSPAACIDSCLRNIHYFGWKSVECYHHIDIDMLLKLSVNL